MEVERGVQPVLGPKLRGLRAVVKLSPGLDLKKRWANLNPGPQILIEARCPTHLYRSGAPEKANVGSRITHQEQESPKYIKAL